MPVSRNRKKKFKERKTLEVMTPQGYKMLSHEVQRIKLKNGKIKKIYHLGSN